jgi:hypothetical protein
MRFGERVFVHAEFGFGMLQEITSARTLSSHRRPGSPPPELLAEKNKSNTLDCK